METFVINSVGTVRREWRNGVEYAIAPLVMLVPGVLNGSQGPLYYPDETVRKNPGVWNGIPITLGHPKVNGKFVSVNHEGVLSSVGIGRVWNDRYDHGKRKAEGWFDVERTRAIAPEVMDYLDKRKAIELSTGLETQKQPARNNATHKGRAYIATVLDYEPDHLAILPGAVGACSNKDGCGVLVNRSSDMGNGAACGCNPTSVTTNAAPAPAFWNNLVSFLQAVPVPGGSPTNNAGGGVPSDMLDMSPEKACQILKDGTVHGKELTEAQKGMFGALCGQRDKGGKTANIDIPYNDRLSFINKAFYEEHPTTYDVNDGRMQACYIMDVFDDYIVYSEQGDLYRQGYEMSDNGDVTFDSTIDEVQRVTTYEPVDNANPTQARDPDSNRFAKKGYVVLKHAVREGTKHLKESDKRGQWASGRKVTDADTAAADAHSPTAVLGIPTVPSNVDANHSVVSDSLHPLEDFTMAMKLNDPQRKQIKDELAANVNTQAGKAWRDLDLNQLSDDALVAHHRHLKTGNQEVGIVNPDGSRVTYNSSSGQFEYVPAPQQGQQTNNQGQPQQGQGQVKTGTGNPVVDALTGNCGTANAKPKSVKEALEQFGTPQEKEMWGAVENAYTQRKVAAIEPLVANLEGAAKQKAVESLATMPIEVLEQMAQGQAAAQPTNNQNNNGANGAFGSVLNYFGGAGAPANNAKVTQKGLPQPKYDFKKAQ